MTDRRDALKTARRRGLGQSIVEMALILPIFLLICVSILDLGRAFYSHERIQNAAREGAAWLALRPTASSTAVQSRVQSEGVACVNNGVAEPVQVTSAGVANEQATVTVTCGFDLVTPFMGAALGSTPPCSNLMGIQLCQPNQHIVLQGRAQMPVVWSGG